jgi:hypothetical protein
LEAAAAELLKDVEEQDEAEEAAGEVGGAASTVVAVAVAGSVSASVTASVSASVASSVAASAAGAAAGAAGGAVGGAVGGAAGGTVGGGAGGSGGAGGGAAVALIFGLQKLSVISGTSLMKDKMPIVSGLGEQFQWTNLMFSLGGNNTNGSSWGSNGTNTTVGVTRMLADSGARMHRSLARGAKGVGTFARIGTRRFRRWNTKRREQNQTIFTVFSKTGVQVAETIRMLAVAGIIGSSNSSNGTNGTNATNALDFDACGLPAPEKVSSITLASAPTRTVTRVTGDALVESELGEGDGDALEAGNARDDLLEALDDGMEEKLQGNLFICTTIFVLVCVIHVGLHRIVVLPHRALLVGHVVSAYAVTNIQKVYRGKLSRKRPRGAEAKEGSCEAWIGNIGDSIAGSVGKPVDGSSTSSNNTMAYPTQQSLFKVEVEAEGATPFGNTRMFKRNGPFAKQRIRKHLYDLSQPVVYAVHRSLYEASPYYYLATNGVHDAIKANPFPKPELFVLAAMYQGVCQSSTAIMLLAGNPVKSIAAGIIFVLVPCGYLCFLAYHCVYQVLIKGRVKYVVVAKKGKDKEKEKYAEDGERTQEEIEGEAATQLRVVVRGRQTRKDAKRKSEEDEAAKTLQHGARMPSRRKSANKQQEDRAAKTLQRAAQKHNSRKKKVQEEKEALAATQMQRLVRAGQGRKETRRQTEPTLVNSYEEQGTLQRHHSLNVLTDFGNDVQDFAADVENGFDGTEQQQEEEEGGGGQQQEEQEDGWQDAVEGDGYVKRYGGILDGFTTPYSASLFVTLEAFRMLTVGWCLSVLVGGGSRSLTQ